MIIIFYHHPYHQIFIRSSSREKRVQLRRANKIIFESSNFKLLAEKHL